MDLVIIEGAGKKETIEKYLGTGYRVFATKGHVRDLPVRTLAVNAAKNFEPRYVIMDDKKIIVDDLIKKAKASDNIYLATDPDREGEAISWHLAHILEIPEDKKARIVFNEISKKAVQQALASPREIDINLVNAQQARRVLDRLVGYKLSPVLCKKIQKNLSAGRVQSVTLKLVVDREREIRNFNPEEYWTLTATLYKGNEKTLLFKAALIQKDGKKIKVTSKAQMDQVLAGIENAVYTVASVKKSVTKVHAPAPFITSTMQQDALNKLGLSLKSTQSAAQELYEGVNLGDEGKTALVTYIRTDSTRVSPDAIAAAREYITKKYGVKYVPEKPNYYASKKGAQDAHEAIRPIAPERTPESVKPYLSPANYKLYKLIYERFLASQMSEAQYNTVAVDIAANNYTFRANGRTVLFDGYTAVYNTHIEENKDGDGEEGNNAKIPPLDEGDRLNLEKLLPEQKFTKPPPRYTEASLVKAMEDKGIGRPATYTPTVATLFARGYLEKDGKALIPKELGFQVTDMLVKYFEDIMDVQFTADMETKLDSIEDGGKIWQNVIGEFYNGFEEKIAAAMGDSFSLKPPDEMTDIICDKCGGRMVIKTGRFGRFISCPNYPKCKNIKNIDDQGNIVEKKEKPPAEPSGVKCDKCGADMVVKEGRYGKFLSCSAYPKCKSIKKLENDAKAAEKGAEAGAGTDIDIKCDKCGKPMVQKQGRYGKFLSCSGYPECKNIKNIGRDGKITESKPKEPPVVTDVDCDKCGAKMVIKTGPKGKFLACPNYPKCRNAKPYKE